MILDPNAKGTVDRWFGNLWFDLTGQEEKCTWRSIAEVNAYHWTIAGFCFLAGLTFMPWSCALWLVSARKIWLIYD